MTEPRTDWHQWHTAYEDPDSRLSQRLRVVQAHVRNALEARAGTDGEISIVSMCAGQGRDVIGALAGHPQRDNVSALLVELDSGLAESARQTAREAGIDRLQVLCGDASISTTYAHATRADILLACGIFGNITNDDIQHTIVQLPMLCAPGATVIWTRYGRPGDDLGPTICGWFEESGYERAGYHASDERSFRVGSHQLIRQPSSFEPDVRFFTFTR
jgi:hypothetical protein